MPSKTFNSKSKYVTTYRKIKAYVTAVMDAMSRGQTNVTENKDKRVTDPHACPLMHNSYLFANRSRLLIILGNISVRPFIVSPVSSNSLIKKSLFLINCKLKS